MIDGNCPSCSMDLPPRGVYCPSCGAQARCKGCRELLEPQAYACVECGTQVGAAAALPVGNGELVSAAAVNRLRYEETRTSRSLEAVFTDQAVVSLGPPLGAILSGRIDQPVRRPRMDNDRHVLAAGPPSDVEVVDSPDVIDTEGTEVPDQSSMAAAGGTLERDKLLNIFRYEGDRLRLDQSQLKGANKKDTVRRLTYLFLLGHDVEGRPQVPRTSVVEAIKDAGWFDSNTRKVFANTSDLFIDGDSVGLRQTGKEKARAFLSQALNPDIPNTPDPRTAAKRRTVGSGDEDGSVSDGGSTTRAKKRRGSKKADAWVAAWKALGLGVNAHAVLQQRPTVDKGLFGLWAIRQAVGDDGKVVSRLTLADFIYGAFEYKVDDRQLERDLKTSDTAKGRVIHVQGTMFQINQTGIEYVEQLAGLATKK